MERTVAIGKRKDGEAERGQGPPHKRSLKEMPAKMLTKMTVDKRAAAVEKTLRKESGLLPQFPVHPCPFPFRRQSEALELLAKLEGKGWAENSIHF